MDLINKIRLPLNKLTVYNSKELQIEKNQKRKNGLL